MNRFLNRPALCGAASAMSMGLLVACGGDDGGVSADAAGMTTLTVIYSDNANAAGFSLGIDRGIFRDHGLDIQALPPASTAGADEIPLLLNGQAQLGVTDLTAVPSALSKGLGVQIVSGLVADYESADSSTFALMVAADSGIESFRDLEGRTVGVSGLNSFWTLEVQEAVRKDGGDPDKVELLAVPFANQAATLEQGRVDAVNTLQPFVSQLQAAGFVSLGDPAAISLGPQSVGNGVMASTEFVNDNPEVMERFTEAWAESVEYANAHPDEVRDHIVEITGAPTEAVANLPLPWYVSGVKRDSVSKLMDLMVQYELLDEALPIDEVVWPEATEADLSTPPSGITLRQP